MIKTSILLACVAFCTLAAGPTTQPGAAVAPPTSQPSTQPAAANPAGGVSGYAAAKAAYQLRDFSRAAELADQTARELLRGRTAAADPAMVNALHLQAVSLLKLGQTKKAGELFSRLSSVAGSSRALSFNMGLCDLQDKSSILRAAKMLGTYAGSHTSDELVMNLWGNVLDTVGREGKNPAKLKEFAIAYDRANGQLEATRPGMRRWGTQWMNADEFRVIDGQRAFQQQRVDGAVRDRDRAVAKLKSAQAALDNARVPISVRGVKSTCSYVGDGCMVCLEREHQYRIDSAQREVNECGPRAQDAITRYQQELAKLPKPTWAMSLEPLDPFE